MGDVVTYVRNRNINYTNVCTFKCRFCGFSKGPLSLNLRGNPYLLTLEDIQQRVVEAASRGATEVCLQGGIHPDFDGDYYLDVTRAVHEAAPDIHIHGFTALEVTRALAASSEPLASYLTRLRDAGLRTLPGTAAEILDDEVRAMLCPDKIDTDEWLEVHRTAHGVGLCVEHHHHVRLDRAPRLLGPSPRAHPRPATPRPVASPSSSRCRSCTWRHPSTSSTRPAVAPRSARPSSCTPWAASPTTASSTTSRSPG